MYLVVYKPHFYLGLGQTTYDLKHHFPPQPPKNPQCSCWCSLLQGTDWFTKFETVDSGLHDPKVSLMDEQNEQNVFPTVFHKFIFSSPPFQVHETSCLEYESGHIYWKVEIRIRKRLKGRSCLPTPTLFSANFKPRGDSKQHLFLLWALPPKLRAVNWQNKLPMPT